MLFFPAVPHERRPPPFETSGRSFEAISVAKDALNASRISYQIKATPVDCAFGFPLLGVGFLRVTEFEFMQCRCMCHITDSFFTCVFILQRSLQENTYLLFVLHLGNVVELWSEAEVK